jgi:hypothetical protein
MRTDRQEYDRCPISRREEKAHSATPATSARSIVNIEAEAALQ